MVKNLAYKIKNARLRKLPVIGALAVALITPTAMGAYAQENTDEPVQIPIANLDENGELQTELPEPMETPDPTPEDTEEPPVAPEEHEVVEPPVEEVDNPEENEEEIPLTETPQEALDRYITFAQDEHPGVEIASVKFVWKQGVKSAKIAFVDGWKVFIGVSDGSTLKVADAENRVKKCQKRMLSNRSWNRWYKTHKSYYQWWLSQQQNESEEETEDGQAELQTTGLRGASAQNQETSRKQNKQNKKSSRGWNNRNRR